MGITKGVGSNMTLLPIWMESLTPEIIQKAEEELGETEEVRIQALKDLRRLIKDEKDFHPQLDDAFLLRFLRTKKFNCEIAFRTLRNYYTFKARYAGLITDFTPCQVKHILEMNMIWPMPKRLPDGTAVGIIRVGHFDVNVATPEDLFAACLICLEVALETEATQISGGVIIFDLDKFGMRHLRHFASPTFLYRLVRMVQDCLPVRIRGFHLVNEPFFFSAIFNIIKQLLSEKLKSRIYFHGTNMKSLHKVIPPELLPKELGGTSGPMDNSDFRRRVLNRQEHIEQINRYGFQEKRIQFIRRKSSRAIFL